MAVNITRNDMNESKLCRKERNKNDEIKQVDEHSDRRM